jgi:hypothetical protein
MYPKLWDVTGCCFSDLRVHMADVRGGKQPARSTAVALKFVRIVSGVDPPDELWREMQKKLEKSPDPEKEKKEPRSEVDVVFQDPSGELLSALIKLMKFVVFINHSLSFVSHNTENKYHF